MYTFTMGNNSSNHIMLTSVINGKVSPTNKSRMISPRNTDCVNKIVVAIGDCGDDIIKNITVPDAGYKSVLLSIGAQVFTGTLSSDKKWHFRDPIPLFKIPNEKCYLTIYNLNNNAVPINYEYESCSVSETVKQRCNSTAVVSGNLIYRDGMVY